MSKRSKQRARIAAALTKAAPAGPMAFEGAVEVGNDSSRGYIYFPFAKGKDQFHGYTRAEARRLSQWAAWHIPAARKATRDIARKIGVVTLYANTKDKEFNEEHARWYFNMYRRKAGNYDVSGKYTEAGFVRNALNCMFRDGDMGIAHVTGDDGEPLVAAVESTLIEGGDGEKWMDGVLVGDQNEHIAYNLNPEQGYKKGTIVSAANLHLFANYEIHSSVRGTPALTCNLPRVRDLREIDNAAVKAAKIQALVAFYLKRELGATTDAVGTFSGKLRKENMAAQGTQTTANYGAPSSVPRKINEVFDDSEMADFPPGIVPALLNDGRDFSAQTPLKEDIYRAVAWGAGLHEAALFGLKGLSGPEQRAVLMETHEWQLAWLDMELDFMVVDYLRRTEWGIRTRQIRRPKDPAWWSFGINYPKSITIDIGRDAAAQEKRLESGLTNYQMEYGECGEQWEPHVEQWLQEKAYVKRRAKELGIEDMIRPDKKAGEASTDEKIAALQTMMSALAERLGVS